MKKMLMEALLQPLSVSVLAVAALAIALPASAQQSKPLAARIATPIDDADRVTLTGTRASRSTLAHDIGPVDPATSMHAIALDFNLTAEQKSDLDALVAAQQDTRSPLYHQWLTPEQYAARFGVSAFDIAAVSSWLKLHGFAIERTARGSNRIVFSGTAAQVEAAFSTQIHNFQSRDGSIHFAPAHDIALPAAFASTVMTVRNLHNYLPKPRRKKSNYPQARLRPRFTDVNQPSGIEYALTPPDLATIYDVNAAYKAGYNGAGQTIAIIGQSYSLPSDTARFESLIGVNAKVPIYVLVPGTGTPLLVPGDEGESDTDLQWSSSMAPGAQVYFVYTGSYMTGVGESLTYAVDERIASIVSESYGLCEVDQAEGATSAATEIADQDLLYEQGIAQGQTFIASSGDDGSADCIEDGDAASTGQSAAVDYPSSSPYVTGVGGTQFPLADYTSNASTYWLSNAVGSAPLASSAKSYIPEQVWNDDDPYFGTSSGGGGVSLYEASPTWQTPGTVIGGVPIPTVAKITLGSGKNATSVYPRLVPDIALAASPNDPGLLDCSSDASGFFAGQTGSCVNGFYDATGTYLTIAGGTSYSAPTFAGMLAVIAQAQNSTGLGNVNSTMYGIAATSTATYNSAFHDITSGSNACYDFYSSEAGYPAPPAPMPGICGVGVATTEYSAATGYDMASGLGSVDVYNLLTAWPKAGNATLLATTTTLTPSTGTPALSTSDVITIAVTSATTTPTGTVSVSVDNVVAAAALPLSNGSATYTFASGVLGTHIVTATYSDDTSHAPSSGLTTLYVGTTTPSFSISATAITVVHGNSASSTVTITPAAGYTGLVNLALSAPSNLANACAVFPGSQSVASASAVPVTFAVYTNSNNCPSGATTLASIGHGATAIGTTAQSARNIPAPQQSPWKRSPLPVAFAGMLLACSLRRRARAAHALFSFLCLAALGLAALSLSGCTPGATLASAPASVSTTSYTSAPGTYTLTVTASDSTNPTLTSTATITLTVQ